VSVFIQAQKRKSKQIEGQLEQQTICDMKQAAISHVETLNSLPYVPTQMLESDQLHSCAGTFKEGQGGYKERRHVAVQTLAV
jgi:hypothetical protein